ncbi:MAG: CorA family divalent cation transporter [Anaerolineae bacterium]
MATACSGWISGETPEASLPILESFDFHPLAIDDALQEIHSPKVDDWDEYLYIVLNYMMVNTDWEADIDELDIFVGRNYIVTHHDQPMDFVDEVWALYLRDPRHAREGADHLLLPPGR